MCKITQCVSNYTLYVKLHTFWKLHILCNIKSVSFTYPSKILHLTDFFYTTSGCDGCDKYEVCVCFVCVCAFLCVTKEHLVKQVDRFWALKDRCICPDLHRIDKSMQSNCSHQCNQNCLKRNIFKAAILVANSSVVIMTSSSMVVRSASCGPRTMVVVRKRSGSCGPRLASTLTQRFCNICTWSCLSLFKVTGSEIAWLWSVSCCLTFLDPEICAQLGTFCALHKMCPSF